MKSEETSSVQSSDEDKDQNTVKSQDESEDEHSGSVNSEDESSGKDKKSKDESEDEKPVSSEDESSGEDKKRNDDQSEEDEAQEDEEEHRKENKEELDSEQEDTKEAVTPGVTKNSTTLTPYVIPVNNAAHLTFYPFSDKPDSKNKIFSIESWQHDGPITIKLPNNRMITYKSVGEAWTQIKSIQNDTLYDHLVALFQARYSVDETFKNALDSTFSVPPISWIVFETKTSHSTLGFTDGGSNYYGKALMQVRDQNAELTKNLKWEQHVYDSEYEKYFIQQHNEQLRNLKLKYPYKSTIADLADHAQKMTASKMEPQVDRGSLNRIKPEEVITKKLEVLREKLPSIEIVGSGTKYEFYERENLTQKEGKAPKDKGERKILFTAEVPPNSSKAKITMNVEDLEAYKNAILSFQIINENTKIRIRAADANLENLGKAIASLKSDNLLKTTSIIINDITIDLNNPLVSIQEARKTQSSPKSIPIVPPPPPPHKAPSAQPTPTPKTVALPSTPKTEALPSNQKNEKTKGLFDQESDSSSDDEPGQGLFDDFDTKEPRPSNSNSQPEKPDPSYERTTPGNTR